MSDIVVGCNLKNRMFSDDGSEDNYGVRKTNSDFTDMLFVDEIFNNNKLFNQMLDLLREEEEEEEEVLTMGMVRTSSTPILPYQIKIC
jgi:hypothetical protein